MTVQPKICCGAQRGKDRQTQGFKQGTKSEREGCVSNRGIVSLLRSRTQEQVTTVFSQLNDTKVIKSTRCDVKKCVFFLFIET